MATGCHRCIKLPCNTIAFYADFLYRIMHLLLKQRNRNVSQFNEVYLFCNAIIVALCNAVSLVLQGNPPLDFKSKLSVIMLSWFVLIIKVQGIMLLQMSKLCYFPMNLVHKLGGLSRNREILASFTPY